LRPKNPFPLDCRPIFTVKMARCRLGRGLAIENAVTNQSCAGFYDRKLPHTALPPDFAWPKCAEGRFPMTFPEPFPYAVNW